MPLERPSLEELALPDQSPLKKRRADVLRVTSEALDRARTLTLAPELADFAEAFTERLSSLTTDPGGALVLPLGSHLHNVTEAVKLGAAFAESADPVRGRVTTVDPVAACAKNFAAYRHTHFEPKDLGVMGYFSAQCGFYLPLAGATTEYVLPSVDEVLDAANRAAPAYNATTAMLDLVWDKLVGE